MSKEVTHFFYIYNLDKNIENLQLKEERKTTKTY